MGHPLQDARNEKKGNALAQNRAVPRGVPEGSLRDGAWDTKNAAELLRRRAAKMNHAVVFDRVVDAGGRIEAEREFHYLSCRRCDLERQAAFIEKQGR